VRACVSFLALCALLACALPRAARAQDQSQAELVRDAHEESKAGDHSEARKLFRRANDKRQSATLWAAIAQESAALGDRAETVRSGRAALGHPVEALGPVQRQQIMALVQSALQSLGEYIMDVQPADAEIAVDGQPVVLGSERSILLEPGPHSIHFLRDGYLPRSFELESKAGDRQSVQFRLERPLQPIFGGEDITEPEEEEDDDDFPVIPVIITSIGGATLLAGGITALVALDNEGDLEDRCGESPQFCPNHNTALRSSAEDLAVATNVLWVVGGLTTAVGVTWLVLELSGDDEEEEADPSFATLDLAPGYGGVRMFGSF
jgi:hypothetical protein